MSKIGPLGVTVLRRLDADAACIRYDVEDPAGQGPATLWRFSTSHPVARPKRLEQLSATVREAESYAHPNLLRPLHLGADDGGVWALTSGILGPVSTALADGLASPDRGVNWLLQLTGALATLHERGRMHGAVHARSVLLGVDHRVRLCLPAWMAQTVHAAHAGSTHHRLDFRAPEQRIGLHSAFDPRVDVFAAGALLAWMVTGEPPGDLRTNGEPSAALSRQPEALQEVILRATHQRAEERYPDAARMSRALLWALDRLELEPEPLARDAMEPLGPAYAPAPSAPNAAPSLAPPPPPGASPHPSLPADETERLMVLLRAALLDTDAEERFDRYTRFAAQVLDAPIALVSLVDADRQWFKSRQGLPATQTPRADAFCAHALHHPDQILEVSDATKDVRFATNPLVTGAPNIRFYAGHPIQIGGHPVGTVCLIDQKPRTLTLEERALLREVATLVDQELSSERSRRVDPETGLSDFDGFVLLANLALARHRAQAEPVTLVHLTRDPARCPAKALADGLLAAFPDAEVVARIDADSFCLLTDPHTDAAARLTRLDHALGGARLPVLRWTSVTLDPSEDRTIAAVLAEGESLLAGAARSA